MAIVTRITEQRRDPDRRNVHLDGKFALAVRASVAARFGLRVGMELSPADVEAIGMGEARQACLDAALEMLGRRMHSRAELRRKLVRRERWGEGLIDQVLDELARLGYVDDARYARARAMGARERRHHGRRRARVELMKAGVEAAVADAALDEVYADQGAGVAVARELAMKHAPRLRKLEPAVARRRLVGMLLRRGFDYEAIRPVVEEVLGRAEEE